MVDKPEWLEISLRDGEQMVVNGALLAATGPCKLRVSGGASVLRGKSLRSVMGKPTPAHELYYAALAAAGADAQLGDSRYRLFTLLGAVVAQYRTFAAQEDCARFAAALISEDAESLLSAARRLATREARGLGIAGIAESAEAA